ncbi:MAG: anti-sigma factor [Pseudomonadota bacterium]
MNIRDLELIDRLAAEYVVGTMSSRARRRFAALMRDDLRLRRAVHDWEHRLAGLNAGQELMMPPASSWHAIEAAIDAFEGNPVTSPQVASRWLKSALAASLALIVAVAALLYFPERGDRFDAPVYTSALAGSDGAVTFVVDAFDDSSTVRIRDLNVSPPGDGLIYQLWAVPPGGAAPQSLGLLGDGQVSRLELSESQYDALINATVLAISIEPAGGSPTGAPTGPIPFSGSLVGS